MLHLLALALVGLTAASPIGGRQVPHYPPLSSSTGFRLVANVTDPSKDFTPSIQNWLLQAYHVGAGLNIAVLHANDSENLGPIFYENGTVAQAFEGDTTVTTDGGTPLYPYGIQVQNQSESTSPDTPDEHGVSVNGGLGTRASISGFPDPYPTLVNGLGYGTFVACNRTVEYYRTNFIVVEYAYATFTDVDGGYDYQANLPGGCVPITLVAQCAVLEALPPGSVSSHAFAQTVGCYDDVAAIVWSDYGP